MIEIKVIKGDKGYDLNFTLQKSDGTALDLTGATLLFKVQKQDSNSLKFSSGMTVIDANQGKCKYNVKEGDFDEVGKYYGEIEVNYGGVQILTFNDIIIIVEPELPK
jgi:co-chaperonin GroES (HSP10)